MKKLLIHNNNTFLNQTDYFEIEEQFVFGFNTDNVEIDKIINQELSQGILQSKIIRSDVVFIKISLSKNYLEYLGLRLAYHIRLTIELGNKSAIPIVFIAEEDIQFVGITSEIPSLLFTRGIYFMKDNVDGFKAYQELIKKNKLNESLAIDLFKKKITLPAPNNYLSHHSIDNELALLTWSRLLGCYDKLPFKKLEFNNSLYYKLHKKEKDIDSNILAEDVIKKKGRVLLIDDEFDKGWHIFYKSLFQNKEILFDSVKLKFKKTQKDEIIEQCFITVKKFNPDVVLLDLRLTEDDFNESVKTTELTGYKILQLIKQYDKGIRVIVFTASNKLWNFKALQNIGFSDYILKSIDGNPAEVLNSIKEILNKNLESSRFLKECNKKIEKIRAFIIKDKSTIDVVDNDLVSKISYNLDISFSLIENYTVDVKYLSFAFLQLFHIIEYYLQCNKVFHLGYNNNYVNIDDENEVLVLSVMGKQGKRKKYKSAIKWGNGHYEIGISDYNNRIDTNFKMSSVLIFKYGFQTSGSLNWTKINNNRNSKAGHAGEIISSDELLELLVFLEYIFDAKKIKKQNVDKGLPKPSIEEEKKKLLEKFNNKF